MKLARLRVIVPEHPATAPDTPNGSITGRPCHFYGRDQALGGYTLVGSSLGGWLAAEIAVRSTAKLRSLVLSAAAGIHVKGLSKGDFFLWSREESARNLFHDQKLAEQMLAQPVSDEQQMTEAKNRLISAKLGWQPRLYNPHLYKWLHRIDVPTLLLWGDGDKVIPPGYGPAYQKLIPGSKLEIIKNCGHVPQMEHMDEWAGKIVAFAQEAGR
jgi:pimeloyl-ACP methyl ester carboxylesterase